MARPDTPELEAVRQVAEVAGLSQVRFDTPKDRLIIPIDLDNGRRQIVFVQGKGETPSGESIVTVFSQALREHWDEILMEHADLQSDLLRHNMTIPFGRFALDDVDGVCTVVVSCDQLVHTLDPPELVAMVTSVAKLADELEHRFERDYF